MEDRFIREICGNRLDQNRVLNANGTRGGILLAWSSVMFEEIQTLVHQFSIAVLLREKNR